MNRHRSLAIGPFRPYLPPMDDDATTLSDDEIETVWTAGDARSPEAQTDDGDDTGDDTGDTSDTSDTGDDSGDDSGDTGDVADD